MQKRLFVYGSIVLGILHGVSVWGQVDLPKGFEGVVPPYPGAEVVSSMELPEASQAVLQTPDIPKDVAAFYKKKLTGAGWTVAMEMNVGMGMMLVFSKGEGTLNLMVTQPPGEKTSVVVNLAKQL